MMQNNLKINIILLSENKLFNKKIEELINSKAIPIHINNTFDIELLSKTDLVIVDKNYYLKNGLRELYKKTKYIIYLIDEEDYNNDFIQTLYKNHVIDIFHSCFISEAIEGKLRGFINRLSEKKTEYILDVILDSIEDSIAITDNQGNLEYVNKGFLKTTGYNLDELIGKNTRVLKSDGHTEGFYKNLWETIHRGEVWSGNFINLSKSGKHIYEVASIYPIDLSSRKYLKIAHNITKNKFLENKVRLSMTLAKNVLKISAPTNFKDERIRFQYFMKYMNELGGDFIWFDKISEDQYFLSLVDVTGHDLSSTLMLMTIITFIKGYKSDEPLTKLVMQINKYLDDFNQTANVVKLISGIFCVLDFKKSQIEYINAGHPSGLIFGRNTLDLVELKGNTMLLGVLDQLNLKSSIIPIKEAFDLILYSDGLLEYYLEDYTKISPKAYRKMFYEDNQLRFLDIEKEILTKEHIKDDLSLAHLRF